MYEIFASNKTIAFHPTEQYSHHDERQLNFFYSKSYLCYVTLSNQNIRFKTSKHYVHIVQNHVIKKLCEAIW